MASTRYKLYYKFITKNMSNQAAALELQNKLEELTDAGYYLYKTLDEGSKVYYFLFKKGDAIA